MAQNENDSEVHISPPFITTIQQIQHGQNEIEKFHSLTM